MSCRWIPARELSIAWGDNPSYWKWTRHASCSSEVAELLNVCWLDITGRVDRKELRVGTRYSAFLVFKLRDRTKCLEKAFVSLNNEKTKTVFLDVNQENINNNNNNDGPLILPHRRSDDWSEIKLGDFFNGSGDDGHVDMMLFEKIDGRWKSGLIVRGIDVRPSNNSDVLNAPNINWFDCPDIDDGDAVLHKINGYNDVASTSSGPTTDHVTIRMCLVLLFCLVFFLLCLVKSHTSILVLFSLMFFFLSVAFFG
ncbi:hypothetical protein ACP275_14G305600 [Erythranthe tilingii]